MAFIDATVVTIALPPMQADLDATFQAVQWVVSGYALFLGGLIVVGGGAGDRLGRRRTFVTGTVIFAVASLACALATSVEWLIVARSVQGIGAALLVPQGLAIIAAAYPKTVRGRAIGTWAGASAITTSLGPVLGGFLIDALHWRAIFLINLPLSAAVIVLALRTYLNIGNLRRERTCHPGTLFWRHCIDPVRFARGSGSQPHYAVVAIRKSHFLERKYHDTFSLRRPNGDPFLAAFRPN